MKKKVLIVCKGNICRSPIAEGLLRKKINENNINDIEIDSAGTGHWHIGKSPDPRAILTAKQNGVDISMLKARQFSTSDFSTFDEIYVMDQENYEKVDSLATSKQQMEKVNKISSFVSTANDEVEDPYHFGEKKFDVIYSQLNMITDQIISVWKN